MRKLLSFLSLLLLPLLLFSQKATIHFEIIDQDSQLPIPSKLVLLQNGKPFMHELESTDDLACRGHTIYTRTGKGTFQLPAGLYEIWCGRGMEYSVDIQNHIFDKGQVVTLKATLKRELNPQGYIGGDMHLHTYTFSNHGDATVEERLISCAAEGLEWAVSTDHNVVLDYQPYMEKLALSQYMSTSVGNEVSTPIGHFNTYPLAADAEKANPNFTVGKELFTEIKDKGITETVIQINHPRWVETDFFNTKGLDPYYGKSRHPEWDWSFDAFEVLNENFGIGWRDAPDNNFSVKQDWFNMLNQGKRKTGLGNSDSHSVISQIAGVPRNYIQSSTENPSEIDEKEMSESVKNQRVSVACGLFANLTANDKHGIGATVHLSATEPVLNLKMEVQAPSWVTCHKAELIENGVVIQTFDIPESKSINRLQETIRLQPKKDSWYVLIAYGDRPMAPMVQGEEKPVFPIGFTNPIWVDADGDQKVQSVYDYSAQLIEKKKDQPKELIAAMEADAALIYPVFYHLFTQKNPMAIRVAQQFLTKADTRQKQLLYRELSKSEGAMARNILMSQRRSNLTPLEEIVLNYYIEFPLNKSKVENYKKKKNTDLEEQLNYLEDIFRFAYSGATKQSFRIAKANEVSNIEAQKWLEIEQNKDYKLPIGQNLKQQEGKYYFIHYPVYARMDTSLSFYIKTNTNVRINRGGRILRSLSANERFPLVAKLVNIELKKGENDLLFRLDGKEDAYISLKEINYNKLIDESLKEVTTVAHLAIDKKVEYLIEPSPKYHGFGIALTDGFRGTTSHSSQLWQGWNGENASFIIDLEQNQSIQKIQIGTLINQKSWIFLPTAIDFFISKNGRDYTLIESKELDALAKERETVQRDIIFDFEKKEARFVKIVAKKLPALPEWHAGKGGDAWIAIDEVIIE
jgi:hypothetical protein